MIDDVVCDASAGRDGSYQSMSSMNDLEVCHWLVEVVSALQYERVPCEYLHELLEVAGCGTVSRSQLARCLDVLENSHIMGVWFWRGGDGKREPAICGLSTRGVASAQRILDRLFIDSRGEVW